MIWGQKEWVLGFEGPNNWVLGYEGLKAKNVGAKMLGFVRKC